MVLIVQGGCNESSNFCHMCSLTWGENKDPPGLLVKELRWGTVPNSCSKGVPSYSANYCSGMALCLFFTLRFQNFWKYTLYFGCRICRNIQNNSWHGDDSFLLLPMCKVCVPLQPVQWLWDLCLCAPVVVPFCYLTFFFIQNVCPQCRNSTLASCSGKSHGFLVYIFYTPFVALDGSLWCCFLKGT